MPLIKCEECGHKIANKAGTRCPNCGNLSRRKDGIIAVISLQIMLSIIGFVILVFTRGDGGYVVSCVFLGLLLVFHSGGAQYKSEFTRKFNYLGFLSLATMFALISFYN